MWSYLMTGCAFGADSFDNVVDLVGCETFGKWNVGYQVLTQTIGGVTYFAVEMTMSFVFVTFSVIVADAVFVRTASVVHTVYQVVFMEKDKCAEYDGLVYAVELPFQGTQTECITVSCDGSVDEKPGGSGADAGRFQYIGIVFSFHKNGCLSVDDGKDKHPFW